MKSQCRECAMIALKGQRQATQSAHSRISVIALSIIDQHEDYRKGGGSGQSNLHGYPNCPLRVGREHCHFPMRLQGEAAQPRPVVRQGRPTSVRFRCLP